MIKATAKADSLPQDLRKFWEDLMAQKFAMTLDEAIGYINTRYGDRCQAMYDGDKIRVQIVMPMEGTYAFTFGLGNGGTTLNLGGSSSIVNPQMPGQTRTEYIYITDFLATSIDKIIKEYYGQKTR